jgi:hypothetical protein
MGSPGSTTSLEAPHHWRSVHALGAGRQACHAATHLELPKLPCDEGVEERVRFGGDEAPAPVHTGAETRKVLLAQGREVLQPVLRVLKSHTQTHTYERDITVEPSNTKLCVRMCAACMRPPSTHQTPKQSP